MLGIMDKQRQIRMGKELGLERVELRHFVHKEEAAAKTERALAREEKEKTEKEELAELAK